MLAIVQDAYGAPENVLQLKEVVRPRISDDEVLVKVRAAPVAGDDWHLMRGIPYVARLATGLLRPKSRVPGREMAGQVVAVGANVAAFKQGDEVFGWCDGAFAEYVAVAENALVRKPENVTLAQAAAVPISSLTALQALRDGGNVQPGNRVLINGASGGVGTFAVQIAKAFGAEVTAVCSARNAEFVRSLGADRVIDYASEDFTKTKERYDLILDLVGNHSLPECRRALNPEGRLVLVGGSGGRWLKGTERFLKALFLSPFVRQTLRPVIHTKSRSDLAMVKKLIETGRVTPVVEAQFPLRRVRDAIHHLGDGHGRGKVVLDI